MLWKICYEISKEILRMLSFKRLPLRSSFLCHLKANFIWSEMKFLFEFIVEEGSIADAYADHNTTNRVLFCVGALMVLMLAYVGIGWLALITFVTLWGISAGIGA